MRTLITDPPKPEVSDFTTRACYACKEPSSDLKVDSYYEKPVCPKCFAEVEEMERDMADGEPSIATLIQVAVNDLEDPIFVQPCGCVPGEKPDYTGKITSLFFREARA